MSQAVFRFAPSPNGALHLGHAYSALLNAKLAQEAGGRFLVRIEDIDTLRCAPELASRALEDLEWLGLEWEQPVRYQSRHLAGYREVQQSLRDAGLLYPCFCSRKELASISMAADPEGQPLYPETCRRLSAKDRQDLIASGRPHAWRLDVTRACGLAKDEAALEWGDVVLVRKDIGTSYHIAVVADDALQGVTHVVRGQDLLRCTSIHLLLQRLLSLPSPIYRHHDLIEDDAGRKLAKSEGARSLASLRAEGVAASQIRRALGFD